MSDVWLTHGDSREDTTRDRAATAIDTARVWTREKAEIARRTAGDSPAAAGVVAGVTALVAATVFGIGEVIAAGVVAYAAFQILGRRRAARNDRLLAATKTGAPLK